MSRIRYFLNKTLLQGVFMSVVTILLLRAGGTDAVALALSYGQWNVIPSPNVSSDNTLTSVTAISPSDAWVVGNAYQMGQQSLASFTEHWDGTQWSIIPNPNPGPVENHLNGVAAVATSDVWAVGKYLTDNGQLLGNTLVEHWDGTQWSVISSPNNGTNSELNGVAVVASNDVWAVGDDSSTTVLIEHWDGTQWSIVPSPNPGGVGSVLNAVTVVAANDIWAVGVLYPCHGTYCTEPLIEHWNGSKWKVINSRDTHNSLTLLHAVAGSSSDSVWAAGNRTNPSKSVYKKFIEHWDGSKWRDAPSPNPGNYSTGFSGLAAVSANNVWAVGGYENKGQPKLHTLIEHWDGTSWQVVPSPNPGSGGGVFTAVAASSANAVWAVGDYADGSNTNTLIEFYC